MLTKFMVRNYRNFRENICIDFKNIAGYQFSTDCITDNVIGKILIYGRNATGKTNLGKAVMNICATLLTGARYMNDRTFLNVDSVENSAVFFYEFQFDDKKLIYRYVRLSDTELQSEELIIDGIAIFKCDFANKEYNFDNLNYIDADTVNIERYLQSFESGEAMDCHLGTQLPFLRWMLFNVALKRGSVLIKLYSYVEKMIMIKTSDAMMLHPTRMNEAFFESLEEPEELKELEDFINAMGIACKLELRKLPDGQRELYFVHEKLVPFFENASSGTLALINLYHRVVSRITDASFLYLDEFDAFYHYEMAEKVISYFSRRYPKCQMIMTSHNTNLMTNRLMRPDCLFILSRAGTLTSLCNATKRELREGHNLEKMYVSGEFEKYE